MGDRCWKEEKARDPLGLQKRDRLDYWDMVGMSPIISDLRGLRRREKPEIFQHSTQAVNMTRLRQWTI